MISTRLETNFNRLLHRCEAMAADKECSDWRLEKYVAALQDYLAELRTASSGRPSQEVLIEYTRKVDFLKGIIDTEKLDDVSEKVDNMLTTVTKPSVSATQGRELHVHTKARYQKQMRDELLGNVITEEDGVIRQRKPDSSRTSPEEDIGVLLKHHNEMQGKLAEEMVHLARNLKEHARAAGKVVRDDTKRIDESNRLADQNFSKLKVESERLEGHVNKSCNWWILIMIFVVAFSFIWMILFMKMFPKR